MSVKVLMCRVGKPPEVESIDTSLKSLQAIVGGDVQAIHLPDGILLYCNEERGGQPFNRDVPARAMEAPEGAFVVRMHPGLAKPGEMGVHQIHGTFFLVRHEYGNLIDITDEEVEKYSSILAVCLNCGSKPAYHGAQYCGAACAASYGA